MATKEHAPARHPDVVTRRVAGETVLVPVRARVGDLDHIFVLDEVGTFIWDLVDGNSTEGKLAEEVVRNFEVDREAAERDLHEFLRDLASVGLLASGDEAK